MQFVRIFFAQYQPRPSLRRAAGVALLALACFTGLAAKALFAQRDFSGNIRIELCQATADGKWKIVDSLDANPNFTASVAELAGGNEVTSKFVWQGRSAKGKPVTVKLARPGKSTFDLRTGKLEINQMPFEVIVDGKQESLSFNLTTESAAGPDGPISGKRAVIKGSEATLAMVASTRLRTDKIIVDEAVAGINKTKTADLAGLKQTQEFLVVVKAHGRLIAR